MSLFDEPGAADAGGSARPDPRGRPVDPAGTKPRHDPDALLPEQRESLLSPRADVEPGDGEELPERVEAAAEPAAGEAPAEEAPHAARFQFVYGVLIGVAIAALSAAAIVFTQGDRTATGTLSNWSAWHPVAGEGDPIAQIIDHVAPEYRLPSGKQIVAVTGGPAEIQTSDSEIPLVVALASDPQHHGDVHVLEGQNVVLYRMCGLGEECAIAEGKPSRERGLYLNREALELALYTFNYVSDVDAVTVLMPPVKGQKPKHAVFFREGDLDPLLQRPLRAILPGPTPTLKGLLHSPNIPVVNSITAPLQFDFSITPDNTNNRGYLVLDTPS